MWAPAVFKYSAAGEDAEESLVLEQWSDRTATDLPARSRMTNTTIVTISGEGVDRMADIWTVAEAKAKFSEVIDRAARKGPQTVTRHGRTAAVVVAADEWERKTRRSGNLAEFLANSPLRRSNLRIERQKDRPRKVDL